MWKLWLQPWRSPCWNKKLKNMIGFAKVNNSYWKSYQAFAHIQPCAHDFLPIIGLLIPQIHILVVFSAINGHDICLHGKLYLVLSCLKSFIVGLGRSSVKWFYQNFWCSRRNLEYKKKIDIFEQFQIYILVCSTTLCIFSW